MSLALGRLRNSDHIWPRSAPAACNPFAAAFNSSVQPVQGTCPVLLYFWHSHRRCSSFISLAIFCLAHCATRRVSTSFRAVVCDPLEHRPAVFATGAGTVFINSIHRWLPGGAGHGCKVCRSGRPKSRHVYLPAQIAVAEHTHYIIAAIYIIVDLSSVPSSWEPVDAERCPGSHRQSCPRSVVTCKV